MFHILVALAEGDLHGYAIMLDVAARTNGKLKLSPGTLYGSIKKMLEDGLIQEIEPKFGASNEDERRRYYRLTRFGRQVAAAEAERLTALLAQALADEHGHVSDKDADDDDDTKAKPLYPTFKSAGERRDAALAKYRSVEAKYAGTGAAMLARLAEGSLLLDATDAKGAEAAFDDVRSSALGQADGEVRGRALEGSGFAAELLAESDAANKDKHLDEALDAFQKLEHVDIDGFKELGMFHQARVLQAKGDKAKAIELLKDVQKRVSEPGDSHPFSYLQFVVEDRLRALDPTALPPKAAKMGPGAAGPSGRGGSRDSAIGSPGGGGGSPGGGGGLDMNDPQVQKILEQLRRKGGTGGAPPVVPQ